MALEEGKMKIQEKSVKTPSWEQKRHFEKERLGQYVIENKSSIKLSLVLKKIKI